mmetsp:Transcript_6972/g.20373  ORF Transcript_6972/g.20373 Transcript_6972/m.20373 type:complete len:661 (+) Transcript_6972:2046-4028(+)
MAPLWDADLVHLGSQDGGRLDERHVHGVVAIKLDCPWESLRRRPERGPVARLGVLWEGVHELGDLVVEVLVEKLPGPHYTFREGGALAAGKGFHHLLELLLRLPVRLLEGVRAVLAGVLQVRVDLGWGFLYVTFELAPRPSQAMVDVVREGVKGAHGSLLLRGVPAGSVVLRQPWDDDLRVALWPQSPRLQEGLGEVHTPHVHVEPRLHVVQSVDHNIQVLPERVVEDVLRLRAHPVLQGCNVEPAVHALSSLARDLALGPPDVSLPEQELPAQVALLNGVVVGHGKLAVLAAGDSHHGQELEELASEGAGSHNESVEALQLLLELLAEDHDLPVVPRPRGLHVLKGGLLPKGLDAVKVEELENGVELARAGLEGLLRHDAADEGGHGAQVPGGDGSELPQELLVELLLLEGSPLALLRQSLVHGVADLHELLRVLGHTGPRQAPLLLLELVQGQERDVEERWPLELGKVAQKEVARVRDALAQRLEVEGLWLLHLGDEAARQVLLEARGVLLELEGVGLDVLHPPGLPVVELGHALHLLELDELPVLKLQPLLLHASDEGRGGLGDRGHDPDLGLLPIHVVHHEAGPEVTEHLGEQSPRIRPDERDRGLVVVAKRVDPLRLLQGTVHAHNDVELRQEPRLLRPARTRHRLNPHRWVQFL